MPKAEVLEADTRVNAEVSQRRQTWFKEGRCPECGELGRLDAFGGGQVLRAWPLLDDGEPAGSPAGGRPGRLPAGGDGG